LVTFTILRECQQIHEAYQPNYHTTWQTMCQWYPYSSPKLFNMFMARQLPLIALVALVFLAVRGRVRPLLPFVVVCTYFMLVHMNTWSEMRYSEPLHPLLAIILMAAGKEGYDWFARKQPHLRIAFPFLEPGDL
jgi:hypothetical protein